jgi:protein-serine/threonine kinase
MHLTEFILMPGKESSKHSSRRSSRHNSRPPSSEGASAAKPRSPTSPPPDVIVSAAAALAPDPNPSPASETAPSKPGSRAGAGAGPAADAAATQKKPEPPAAHQESSHKPTTEVAAQKPCPNGTAQKPDVAAQKHDKSKDTPKDQLGTPKPLEREGTWNRLQRMFTNPGKEPLKAPDRSKQPAASDAAPPPSSSGGKSAAPSVSSEKAVSPDLGAASSSKVATLPVAPEKTTLEKSATATSSASSMKPPSRASTTHAKDLPRFVPESATDSGCHEHHLKSSRRQEKLSAKFKALLGRKHEAVALADHDDLSLVSDWVGATLKREQDEAASVDKKGGPNDTKSLVEKYGKCQEVIGRGAFGIVRISHKKVEHGERLYAVKEFRRRPDESEKRYNKRLMAEYSIGISLMHPNVCRTLDLVRDDKGDLCEVMEFCAGGDLYSLILAAGKLEPQEADCFFKQMMRGVEYLHEMGVAHRDLKPENLLLTTRGALKITDFGNGECFRYAWEDEAHMVTGVCGSAPYIAPEEYVEEEFDGRAVDVWACGVIYMAMRTGRHMWNVAKKDDDFYKAYVAGRKSEDGYAPIEILQRSRCRNVIYSILDPSATRRLTARQVLKTEWLREIKLCRAGEEGL